MVKVLQHHTVVRDSWHNMLTDLIFWRDYYWLAYRRVTSHYDVDGVIIVLRSVDLKRWHEVATLKTVGSDWSPKFCVAKNRLFVYIFTSYPSLVYGGDRFTNVCFTDDGIHWSEPTSVLKNQWMFGMDYHKDVFYGCAYSWKGHIHDHIHGPVDLLTSYDGLNWTKVSTIALAEDNADEADLIFRPNGELWVIAATIGEKDHDKNMSMFYSSKPPYQEWNRFELKTRLAAPCFCELDGKVYVAGSRAQGGPWIPQSGAVGNTAIWRVEKGKVIPFFALPSEGDRWQPSLITTEPNKLIISYNSQHAYLSGVLPSKIPIPYPHDYPSRPPDVKAPDNLIGDDDIFIAEIAAD